MGCVFPNKKQINEPENNTNDTNNINITIIDDTKKLLV